MPFETKTWLDRISEYANRRKLVDASNNESIVTVSRYEGVITQEGDAFSAANMNDLESRISTALSGIAGQVITTSLYANNWNSRLYSFETTYPNTDYDLEIEPDGDSATAAQISAWNSAKMVGSATTNVLKALGTVPSVDIPVILKVVTK